MKEINGVEYFDIDELCKMWENKITKDEMKSYFERGEMKGEKIDGEWYANQKGINSFMDYLAESKSLLVEKQKIEINNFRLDGKILDIGGGGEGIIELYKGEQVVAIDRSKRELEGASENVSLKIIMDAKELKFLDNTFDTVTAFFTLMYVPLANHKIILQEIHRVLKLNGEFALWDLKIPNRGDHKQEFYGLYLEVKINDKIIETGYGTYWQDKEQNMQYYIDLAKSIGFQVLEQHKEEHTFFIRFIKK